MARSPAPSFLNSWNKFCDLKTIQTTQIMSLCYVSTEKIENDSFVKNQLPPLNFYYLKK